MRSRSQRVLLRVNETLDPFGGAVEAACELGDLVATFDSDPRAQIAAAESVDAGTQALEPPREPACKRKAREREGAGEHGDHEQRSERRMAARVIGKQPAAVGKRHDHEHPVAGRMRDAAAGKPRGRRLDARPDAGDRRSAGVEERKIGAEFFRESFERESLLVGRSSGGRQHVADELGHAAEEDFGFAVARCNPPDRAGREREQHERRHERHVNLQVEPMTKAVAVKPLHVLRLCTLAVFTSRLRPAGARTDSLCRGSSAHGADAEGRLRLPRECARRARRCCGRTLHARCRAPCS